MKYKIFIILCFLITSSYLKADWQMLFNNSQHTNFLKTETLPYLSLSWTYLTNNTIISSSAVFGEVLYVGSGDKNLYAINIVDGSLVWKFSSQGSIFSSPAINNNTIFIGSKDKNLYALDAKTGQIKWTYLANGDILASPLVSEGKVFISVGYPEKSIVAINENTGEKIWQIETMQMVYSSPALFSNTLFCGSDDGYLYALDINNGNIKWKFQTNGNMFLSSVSIKDNVVYCFPGNFEKNVYAINITDGSLKWKFKDSVEKILVTGSSVAISDKEVYFQMGFLESYVYCLNADTGDLQWKTLTGKTADFGVLSTPLITNNYIYVGSGDGNIYVLTRDKGEVKTKYPVNSPLISSPVIVNNNLYIGATNGKVYSFSLLSELSKENLPSKEITETKILDNFPNPFNPEVWIPVSIAGGEKVNLAKIKIYNTLGQLIRVLEVNFKNSELCNNQKQSIYWDGRDNQGKTVSSGAYFYQYEINNKMINTKKMLLLK
ncbi:MAG: PQQ-binding-like beta-propeller repeat protein [bacterium]